MVASDLGLLGVERSCYDFGRTIPDPARLVSTGGDPASQLLWELIGMEDIIQGMSRRKFIEIGSVIAPVAVLSCVGVAQQASSMRRCLRALARKISHSTKKVPTLSDLRQQTTVICPPSKYSFSFAHKHIESGRWTRWVTQKDFPISNASLGLTCTSKQITTEHWKEHEFGGKYDLE
jgi:hypothetical protein